MVQMASTILKITLMKNQFKTVNIQFQIFGKTSVIVACSIVDGVDQGANCMPLPFAQMRK